MCGTDVNFLLYCLRKYTHDIRVKKIERFLEDHHQEIDLLVIDGVRDLVRDFNDSIESSAIVGLLMKWSEVYNIHITVVLHANKSDGNMRGHLGAEITNKAELVLNVEKDGDLSGASEVKELFGRGRDMEPFRFNINDQGIPELVDGLSIKESYGSPGPGDFEELIKK